MKNISELIKTLNKDNTKYYSKQAIVTQTYRVKDQQELFAEGKLPVEYDPFKHIVCDVRLVEDGSMVYDVKLTPKIITENETIIDGSPESKLENTRDIPNVTRVDVPLIGSYVYISWLSDEDAYVSFQSHTESIVIGNADGAYIDFYIKDETRIIDLVNCDEFNVQFPRGKYFNIKTDVSSEISELITYLNSILLQTPTTQIDMRDNIDILVSGDQNKIKIENEQVNLKDILNDIISELNGYFQNIEPTLVQAGLTSIPTQNKLNEVNNQVNALFY